ncbi:MAG TPA: Tc toxin subunit A [Arsenophonus sp.]
MTKPCFIATTLFLVVIPTLLIRGNIASMFSPAAYLVKLYREAHKLHAENSPYFIDNRRPDLADLILSQENMD